MLVLTGSLDTLVQATEELGEKGECPTIEMETQDEFARLADAFNGMVTRLRDTQLQLVQSEKLTATGKLSASIAHEINNPLFGIQGCLERVYKRLPEGDSDHRLVALAMIVLIVGLGFYPTALLELAQAAVLRLP